MPAVSGLVEVHSFCPVCQSVPVGVPASVTLKQHLHTHGLDLVPGCPHWGSGSECIYFRSRLSDVIRHGTSRHRTLDKQFRKHIVHGIMVLRDAEAPSRPYYGGLTRTDVALLQHRGDAQDATFADLVLRGLASMALRLTRAVPEAFPSAPQPHSPQQPTLRSSERVKIPRKAGRRGAVSGSPSHKRPCRPSRRCASPRKAVGQQSESQLVTGRPTVGANPVPSARAASAVGGGDPSSLPLTKEAGGSRAPCVKVSSQKGRKNRKKKKCPAAVGVSPPAEGSGENSRLVVVFPTDAAELERTVVLAPFSPLREEEELVDPEAASTQPEIGELSLLADDDFLESEVVDLQIDLDAPPLMSPVQASTPEAPQQSSMTQTESPVEPPQAPRTQDAETQTLISVRTSEFWL